jgi:ATP-dependent exoDNAse (exonuclease V) beta subunit
VPPLLEELHQALLAHDMDGVFEVLQVFYARVDYSIKLRHEKYYQTIFYILFTLLGYRIQVEEHTNKGRMDAVVETDDRIYIFEFKLNMSAEEAVAQIRKKEYFQKYALESRPLTLVGVSFNKETGEIAEWKVEEE